MDIALLKLTQSTEAFLEFLDSSEKYDDFVLGLVIGIEQDQVKSEVKFLKVIWKIWASGHKLGGLMLLKYLQVLRTAVKGINRKNPLYMIEFFVEALQGSGNALIESAGIEEKYANALKQQYLLAYNETLDLYSSCCEAIRIIRIGKEFHRILVTAEDAVLSLQDITDLEKIMDTEDVIPGCKVLNEICKHLSNERNQVLYKLLVSVLIYLMEVKISVEHFNNINQFLGCFRDIFVHEEKEKLMTSYQILCERLGKEQDAELVGLFVTPSKPSKKSPKKNKKNNEKPAETHTERYTVKKAPEPKIKPPVVALNKDFVINLDPPQQKPKEEIKISSKSDNKPEPKPVEKEIEEIIEEAIYSFEEQKNLDTGDFYELFMDLDLKDKESLLFHKVDEIMARGKPNQVKAKFWKIMLKIIEKLPVVSKFEMDALRSKLRAIKGNVRDNKEKVSRQKESKVQYKEELKTSGKFKANFKNGDREQKRGQKPKPKPQPTESEKKINLDFDALNATISLMSQDALLLVRERGMDSESLTAINFNMVILKNALQSRSPSCLVRAIGSASIGTCVKTTQVDLLLVDKKANTEEVLIQALPQSKKLKENCFLVATDSNTSFKVYTENPFAQEVSSLIKKYCLCDTRINELIIFVKVWARENKLDCFTGFHWTLLVVSFLQNTEPPLILSLQEKDHKQKLVADRDVWFDAEYSQQSQNSCSLGQLIYHFFSFYSEHSMITASIKSGKIESRVQGKYVVLHPFTGDEIGNETALEALDGVERTIKNAFGMVIDGEKVATLLRINN